MQDLAPRNEQTHVLLASPEHFKIVDEKNIHMAGHAGLENLPEALRQWENLKNIYEGLKEEGVIESVEVVKGLPGCEDMVFCANQTFPWMVDGEKLVVLSQMTHPSRQKEVPAFGKFFAQKGYRIIRLPGQIYFEGMGDAIPHPGRQLIYGGYGHRSSHEVYSNLATMLHVPVVPLQLVDPRFYHLDTCFLPISEEAVLIYPGAFDEDGLEAINHFFKLVVHIPEQEAAKGFALNAHCIMTGQRGKVAIIQQENPITCKILEQSGYRVIETNTSEFIKSGGSVFCMKMMYD